ncbi:MAG: sulfite exporter TauE/SafE family protein [Acidimicrobiales bacterium]
MAPGQHRCGDGGVARVTVRVVVAVAAAALLIGLMKGGVGGLGPVVTLLVATALPTKIAVGLLLPLLMLGDVSALWAHWGKWHRPSVVALLPGGLVGVAVASLFLRSMSERLLELFIVAISLAFAAYRLLEPRIRTVPLEIRPVHGVAAGVTAGITSTIAHVGGPPIQVYLLGRRLEPREFVATSAMVFTVINWTKVPGYLAAGLFDVELIRQLWPVAFLIPPGIVIGKWFVTRVSAAVFDGLVLASLVVGALLLLV